MNNEGQPVKMKSGKRGSNISLYVDLLEIEELDKIRWREHKSMSEIVRKAIDEYIEKHAEGNDTFRLDTWVNNSEFKAVPTILERDGEKWFKYVQSCNEVERRELTICCNSELKIIQSLELKTDTHLQNNKSYETDRLRNSFDIRNKDPATLTIYQREQLKRYQEASAVQQELQDKGN